MLLATIETRYRKARGVNSCYTNDGQFEICSGIIKKTLRTRGEFTLNMKNWLDTNLANKLPKGVTTNLYLQIIPLK